MKLIIYVQLLLIVLSYGPAASEAEVQAKEVTPKKIGSAELDCRGLKGKLNRDCRALIQKDKSKTTSVDRPELPTFVELDIEETISITSSVKLPEDI